MTSTQAAHDVQVDNVHVELESLFFTWQGDRVTARVTFHSTHPILTGTATSRTFEPGVTVEEILRYHIEDFPKWDRIPT